MTRQDFAFKWLLYAVALLPGLLLEFAVFSRWPLLGVSPVLVPVAAFTVAVLEGPTGGAGYGLFCALFWSAATPGDTGGVFVTLTLLCLLAGLLAQRFLRQNLLGCLLCSLLGLTVWELFRVAVRLFSRAATLPQLLKIALPELLLSLAFVLVIYPLYRAVYRKVGGTKLAD